MATGSDADTKSPLSLSDSAVSLKLGPFYPNDPTLWFALVEAQFVTRGITNQNTKFGYVVPLLPREIQIAQEIRALIVDPPQVDRFEILKTKVILRTSVSESEQKKLLQLLISQELGDKKPSQLLRHMKQLLGDSQLEEKILKQIFCQRLPTYVQQILASISSTCSSTTIEQLADIADKIIEVAVPAMPTISTVGTTSPPQGATADIMPSPSTEQLQSQLQQLKLQLQVEQVQQVQVQQLSSQMIGGAFGQGPTSEHSFSK